MGEKHPATQPQPAAEHRAKQGEEVEVVVVVGEAVVVVVKVVQMATIALCGRNAC